MTTAPSPTETGDRHLRDLHADECWALAASQPVGRLVWQGTTGPCVVPVNFTIGIEEVHVRTAAYSALARECDDSPMTFEVDAFDPATRTGWSVLMHGRAHVDYAHTSEPHPQVWPDGSRALHVILSVHEVSGRRVG